MIVLYIIGGIVALWIIFTYNSFISIDNHVKKSFSGIDVQLKKRADLIPNLVSTVKGYMTHEKSVLTEVTKARTEVLTAHNKEDVREMAKGQEHLTHALKSLFAVAENYPKLKANEHFLELQNQLSRVEGQIAASRRIYNSNVTMLNTKLSSFPSNIIGKLFGFKQKELFESSEQDRAKPASL